MTPPDDDLILDPQTAADDAADDAHTERWQEARARGRETTQPTLVPPEPAEPDCPAILVTYTDGGSPVLLRRTWDGKWGRDYNGYQGGDTWTALLNDVATVQALRPAEYLRGGQ